MEILTVKVCKKMQIQQVFEHLMATITSSTYLPNPDNP